MNIDAELDRKAAEQDELQSTALQNLLRCLPAKDLVQELMTRGVLRAYGATHYVPSVVRSRATVTGEDLDAHAWSARRDRMTPEKFGEVIRATLTHQLIKSAVTNGIVSLSDSAPSDPAAPPNDRVYEAMIMTLDPGYDYDEDAARTVDRDTFVSAFMAIEARIAGTDDA
jgi:hypothetical protein